MRLKHCSLLRSCASQTQLRHGDSILPPPQEVNAAQDTATPAIVPVRSSRGDIFYAIAQASPAPSLPGYAEKTPHGRIDRKTWQSYNKNEDARREAGPHSLYRLGKIFEELF